MCSPLHNFISAVLMASPEACVSVKRETLRVLVMLPIGRQLQQIFYRRLDIWMLATLSPRISQRMNTINKDTKETTLSVARYLAMDDAEVTMHVTWPQLVTTVADNRRQYTKRVVAQARNARELIARLSWIPIITSNNRHAWCWNL